MEEVKRDEEERQDEGAKGQDKGQEECHKEEEKVVLKEEESSTDFTSSYDSSYTGSGSSPEPNQPQNKDTKPEEESPASPPAAHNKGDDVALNGLPASTASSGRSESVTSSSADVTQDGVSESQSKLASDTNTQWTGTATKDAKDGDKEGASEQLDSIDLTSPKTARLEEGTGVHFVRSSRLDQDPELVRSVKRELEGMDDAEESRVTQETTAASPTEMTKPDVDSDDVTTRNEEGETSNTEDKQDATETSEKENSQVIIFIR